MYEEPSTTLIIYGYRPQRQTLQTVLNPEAPTGFLPPRKTLHVPQKHTHLLRR